MRFLSADNQRQDYLLYLFIEKYRFLYLIQREEDRMSQFIAKMSQKQKKEFDDWVEKRKREIPLPKNIEIIRNIPYINDGDKAHTMDLYRTKNKQNENYTKKQPVLINIHGGGLLMGSKEANCYFDSWLTKQGYLVFSVEYRLVPDVQVYGQFQDISFALDKIETLLEQYNGDKEDICLIGDSAGAYLILYTVAMQKNKKIAKAANVSPSALPIKALGFQSGMFYTTKMDKIGIFLPNSLYGKGYKKTAFAPYINPEHPEIIKNLPPVYLMTSKADFLQHYTLNFAKQLEKHNINYELENYPKDTRLPHAFSALYPELEESIAANTKMLKFFQQL